MVRNQAKRRATQHYESRAAERALRPNVEEFLMTWGTERRAAGATHITLVRRDLPPDLQGCEEAARAEDWIIVAGDDGTLVTCYRRANAWRFVRRKSEFRPGRHSRKAA
jgi:hypothetical protein